MAKTVSLPISHDVYSYLGPQAEVNDGKSNVLPDQAFTIQELFDRSRAGMPLAFHEAFYTPDVKLGDLDVSKLAGMDIVNQKIALRSFTDTVERYQAQLDKMYLEETEAAKAKQMAEFMEAQKAEAAKAAASSGTKAQVPS